MIPTWRKRRSEDNWRHTHARTYFLSMACRGLKSYLLDRKEPKLHRISMASMKFFFGSCRLVVDGNFLQNDLQRQTPVRQIDRTSELQYPHFTALVILVCLIKHYSRRHSI